MLQGFGIIIQARVNSNRLQNKVLLPFYKQQSILKILINRLNYLKSNIKIIIATSSNELDNSIEEISLKNNLLCYRGSEHDVLDRFVKTAEKFNIDKIIRICSDNPFILSSYIEKLINYAQEDDYDYISFKNFENKPVIKTHLGLFAEFVKLNALKKVIQLTNLTIFHEHVTNYIYEHPEKFKIKLINLPEIIHSRNDIRLTCDTIDDFNLLKKIYEDYVLKYHTDNITIENIINLIDNNEFYLTEMQKGIQQFQK